MSGFGGFDEGQRTTLSATAKPGFTFDCWRDAKGAQVSGLPECTVTVSGDAAYAACFKRNSYGVSLGSNVEGVGELSGEACTSSARWCTCRRGRPTTAASLAGGWWAPTARRRISPTTQIPGSCSTRT